MHILILVLICFRPNLSLSQDDISNTYNPSEKGRLFIYWGYNRSGYTNSNIAFEGPDYKFELENVTARDRQSPFSFKTYFGLTTFTIPQYNFVVGYFIKKGLSISFNVDHMKYVMVQNQTSTITGHITKENSPYNGTYADEPITLSSDFLSFEHTDGLNYSNIELTRYVNLWSNKKDNLSFSTYFGIAAGILLPRSNVRFLGEGTDQFHLAGFGTSADAGVSITFFQRWVFQYKVKGGYINMPDIVINGSKNQDRAKQDFWFLERLFTVGAAFPISLNN